MTEQLEIMRLPRSGRGFRAAVKLGDQWFHQHSWLSFEDAEAKIRADVRRVAAK